MVMEVEESEQDQDTDLMPKSTEVIPQGSPVPTVEQVLSEQGDTILLEDYLGTYMYSIALMNRNTELYKHVDHAPQMSASPAHLE